MFCFWEPLRYRLPEGGEMAVQTYAGYTRCDHCGIYDWDPHWCDLCQMPKDRNASSEQIEPRSDLAKLRRQPRPEAMRSKGC